MEIKIIWNYLKSSTSLSFSNEFHSSIIRILFKEYFVHSIKNDKLLINSNLYVLQAFKEKLFSNLSKLDKNTILRMKISNKDL